MTSPDNPKKRRDTSHPSHLSSEFRRWLYDALKGRLPALEDRAYWKVVDGAGWGDVIGANTSEGAKIYKRATKQQRRPTPEEQTKLDELFEKSSKAYDVLCEGLAKKHDPATLAAAGAQTSRLADQLLARHYRYVDEKALAYLDGDSALYAAAHTVGLGRDEFERVQRDPKRFVERLETYDYFESFVYCFQSFDAYPNAPLLDALRAHLAPRPAAGLTACRLYDAVEDPKEGFGIVIESSPKKGAGVLYQEAPTIRWLKGVAVKGELVSGADLVGGELLTQWLVDDASLGLPPEALASLGIDASDRGKAVKGDAPRKRRTS